MRTCDRCGKPAAIRSTVETITGEKCPPWYFCCDHADEVGILVTPAMRDEQDKLESVQRALDQ